MMKQILLRTATPASVTIYFSILALGMILQPRFAVLAVPMMALPLLLRAWFLRRRSFSEASVLATPFAHWGSFCVIAFGVWALLASSWSQQPVDGVAKAAHVLALTAIVMCVSATVWSEERAYLNWTLKGLLSGFVIGLLYVCFEQVSHQALARTLLTTWPSLQLGHEKHLWIHDGKLIAVSDANLKRRFAVLTMAFWPMVLALIVLFQQLMGRRRRNVLVFVAIMAALLMLVAALTTTHRSSQLGLAAGGVVLGFGLLNLRAATALVRVGWVAAIVLVVPGAIAAYNHDLYKATWLDKSMQARVIIWSYTAEQVFNAPMLGVGTQSTPALDEEHTVRNSHPQADHVIDRRTARHAHNVFLQVWYELGGAGAVLFLSAGLGLVSRLMLLNDKAAKIVGLSLFATALGLSATSYSLWQPWFLSLFSLAAMVMAIVAAASPAVKIVQPLEAGHLRD